MNCLCRRKIYNNITTFKNLIF